MSWEYSLHKVRGSIPGRGEPCKTLTFGTEIEHQESEPSVTISTDQIKHRSPMIVWDRTFCARLSSLTASP